MQITLKQRKVSCDRTTVTYSPLKRT